MPAGNFRSTIDVVQPPDRGMIELSNLLGPNLPEPPPSLADILPPVGPPAGMKKSESTENLANLTLHQCARNGDARSAKILLGDMGSQAKKRINMEDVHKITPLHYAARYNHLNVIKLLIDNHADMTSKDGDELTPLHYAARYNHPNVIQLLIDNHADMISKDYYGLTPLHYAARYNHPNVIQLLIDNHADVNSKDSVYRTPLHHASMYKRESKRQKPDTDDGTIVPTDGMPKCDTAEYLQLQLSAINFLIGKGANINVRDTYGHTPLHYAAMMGNEVATGELLSFRTVSLEEKDNNDMTALHMAACHNQVEVSKMLIDAGVKLRCKDKEDSTPLHAAASKGNMAIVHMLFEAGAKLDGWDTIQSMVTDKDINGNTCLSLSVENGHYEVVKLILEKRADVNTPNKIHMYPLHLAASKGEVRIVRFLVEHNARIDVLNIEGATPLHKAAQYNHVDCVEFLVDREADIERTDQNNYTPLLLACVFGHAPTVDLLIKKGADVAAVDRNHKTAIFLAAEYNQLSALEALLKYEDVKSMINVSDRDDNDPLHNAAKFGYLPIVRALLKNGADLDNKTEQKETPLHLAASFGRTK